MDCYYQAFGTSLHKGSVQKQEVLELTSHFEKVHVIPKWTGAVDGTHIDIKQPTSDSADKINRKQRYSLNVQAVVIADVIL